MTVSVYAIHIPPHFLRHAPAIGDTAVTLCGIASHVQPTNFTNETDLKTAGVTPRTGPPTGALPSPKRDREPRPATRTIKLLYGKKVPCVDAGLHLGTSSAAGRRCGRNNDAFNFEDLDTPPRKEDDWHRGCVSPGKRLTQVKGLTMYEFLLLALVIIYVTISYRPNSKKRTAKAHIYDNSIQSPAAATAKQRIRHASERDR